jgi:hypothetical protein
VRSTLIGYAQKKPGPAMLSRPGSSIFLIAASAIGASAEAPTTATAAATTAAAAETSTATATTAATAPLIPRLGFIHRQRSATEVGTVEGRDCTIGFAVIFHFDEAESTRAPCLTVHDHLGPGDFPVLLKEVVQVVLRGIPNQVADINVLRHLKTFPSKLRIKNPSSANDLHPRISKALR